MTRALLLIAFAAVAAGAAAAWLVPSDAEAVAPAQVVGTYRLRMKGDGWLRPKGGVYRDERLGGNAVLVLARDGADDARLKCEIRLEPSLDDGLLDLATGEPAFVGTGYIVGDSLAMIDTATPTFSNALTLTFAKGGAKVGGTWMAVFPASDASSVAASAFAVQFEGKRFVLRPAGLGAASDR